MTGRLATLMAVASLAGALFHAGPGRAEPAPPAASNSVGQIAQLSPADQPGPRATPLSEVIVTGRAYGAAPVLDLAPELKLDRADIGAYGVGTVAELLAQLNAQTRSLGAQSGPVVLLNGRRISSFNEISDIPSEAIRSVEVLPGQAAQRLGYSAQQRVVNVVLEPRFRSTVVDGQSSISTEGGALRSRASLNLFRVEHDERTGFTFKAQRDEALTEAARDLAPSTAEPLFDPAGNVTPAVAGAEVDPRLSALVGRPVTVTGVPAASPGQVLTLADFARLAGRVNSTGDGRFRTLLPATEAVSANGVLSRFLPGGVSATFNGALGWNRSRALQGLPGVALTIPSGSPSSPFGSDVVVRRAVVGDGPLRQETTGWTAHLGATLNRVVGRWPLSLLANFDHARSRGRTDTGVDATALQAAVSARSPLAPNPFAELPSALLPRIVDRYGSDLSTLDLKLIGDGSLLRLPAGPVYASVSVGDAQSWYHSSYRRLGVEQTGAQSRNTLAGRVNFDVPVLRRSDHPVGATLGALSLQLGATGSWLSDAGGLGGYTVGGTWSPLSPLSVSLTETRDRIAPTPQELRGPVISTPNVRTFDFITGRTVDITRVEGGNPALGVGDRGRLELGVTYKPLPRRELIFSGAYVRTRDRDTPRALPYATALVEAAFPDRFLRDASGVLQQVDYRPVTIARSDREELRWGASYVGRIGAAASANARPEDRTRWQLAAYHTVLFRDSVLVRRGGPTLDLLAGSAAGFSGGEPRHRVEAQAGFSRGRLGGRLSAEWQDATRVEAGGSPLGALRFSDLLTINLRLFADLGRPDAPAASRRWSDGVRITLIASNIFDQRIRVRDQRGEVPSAYQGAYLDPLGRVITLGIRKAF